MTPSSVYCVNVGNKFYKKHSIIYQRTAQQVPQSHKLLFGPYLSLSWNFFKSFIAWVDLLKMAGKDYRVLSIFCGRYVYFLPNPLSLCIHPEQGSCYTCRNIGTSSTVKHWILLLHGQQKVEKCIVLNCRLETWKFETKIFKLKAP